MLTTAPGRAARFWLMVLFLVALAVQFYLAGRGVFGAGSYDAHKDAGNGLHLLSVIVLIVTIALPATRNRVDIGLAVLLVVLTTVQVAIGSFDHPDAGAFHPVNALLIVGVSWAMLQRDRAPAGTPAPG